MHPLVAKGIAAYEAAIIAIHTLTHAGSAAIEGIQMDRWQCKKWRMESGESAGRLTCWDTSVGLRSFVRRLRWCMCAARTSHTHLQNWSMELNYSMGTHQIQLLSRFTNYTFLFSVHYVIMVIIIFYSWYCFCGAVQIYFTRCFTLSSFFNQWRLIATF